MAEGAFKIILALDISILPIRNIHLIEPYVAGFKVGLELFCSQGPTVLDDLMEITDKPIFLDLKLLDIPTTIEKTIEPFRKYSTLRWLSVHGIGGIDMLKAAHEAASGSFDIAVVSQLTSQDHHLARVEQALADACKVGIKSAVIPPWMLWRFREYYSSLTFLCPGIRMGYKIDDHKYAYTPQQAINAGADFIIIGRPITQTSNWAETVQKIKGDI